MALTVEGHTELDTTEFLKEISMGPYHYKMPDLPFSFLDRAFSYVFFFSQLDFFVPVTCHVVHIFSPVAHD